MQAMQRKAPGVAFDVYTSVPEWFVAESLTGSFAYRYLETDVGLVQRTPVREDLEATLKKLDALLPFDPSTTVRLAGEVLRRRSRLIVCDIAPMGIAVARAAGVPSVLVENFTWDWIYEGYSNRCERIGLHAEYLKKFFDDADHHIQTVPACRPQTVDLTTSPVSRSRRASSQTIRRSLEIPSDAPMIVVTLGGILIGDLIRRVPVPKDFYAVLPGGIPDSDRPIYNGNLRLLPHHSGIYHPDLIHAGDAVIGKLGYSTLAEAYDAGIPFGYLGRQGFRESAVLESFVLDLMQGIALNEEQLQNGSWIDRAAELLAMPRQNRTGENGAEKVAEYILSI